MPVEPIGQRLSASSLPVFSDNKRWAMPILRRGGWAAEGACASLNASIWAQILRLELS
jgi:hypothetical protein